MSLFGLSTVPTLLFFLRLFSLLCPTTHPPSSSVSPYLRQPRPDTGVKHVHAHAILFFKYYIDFTFGSFYQSARGCNY